LYYKDFDKIEKIQGKETLLVCIGDSWTWGDSLGPTLLNTQHMHEEILFSSKHDLVYRQEYCFGNHLKDILNSDWINYGMPGESNLYILKKFEEVITNKEIQENYKKIYYVLTLTETGRELDKLNPTDFQKSDSLDKILSQVEQDVINKIYNLYTGDLKNILILRNFTKSYNSTQYHTKDTKSWIEVNNDHDDVLVKNFNVTGFVTTHAMKNNDKFLSKTVKHWKSQVLKQYEKVEPCKRFLSKSKFHSQKSSKHPTKESHKLWAEYIAELFLLKY
jgi:hypothetical protein